ncbi:MAG: LysR family transcriptional regulator [Oscillospiraceae bacterium]
MDIKQLEYFVEVCRYMSFTKAAANQYISQQGMSKSIKRLEEELGIALFRRSSSSSAHGLCPVLSALCKGDGTQLARLHQ